MTRLVALAGAGCLAVFGWYWHPGAWLIGGLGLLTLAAVRSANERRGRARL